MNVYDLIGMNAHPYEERGKNVFYQTKEFKTRIIILPPGGVMPLCDMADHVLFYVVEGEAEVTVDAAVERLKKRTVPSYAPRDALYENGTRGSNIRRTDNPRTGVGPKSSGIILTLNNFLSIY